MESAAEQIVREFNGSYFLKEFTYYPKVVKKGKAKRELSDGFICLGDKAIFFQTKERGQVPKKPADEKQLNWFNKNVLEVAVSQMMGTLRTFEAKKEIDFWNLREQRMKIKYSALGKKHYVILHHSHPYPFPRECHARKSIRDKASGRFIHIMRARDWVYLCRYLYTPVEVIEYLSFRRKYLNYILGSSKESEKWLLGRFFASPKVPDMNFDGTAIDFTENVDQLIEEYADKVLSFNNILKTFYQKVRISQTPYIDYHKLLLELVKLDRNCRWEFLKRFRQAKEISLKNEIVPIPRFSIRPRTGFVFVPTPYEMNAEKRRKWLEINVQIYKYQRQLKKCLGLCVYSKSEKKFFVDWLLKEFTWEEDEKMDEAVKLFYQDLQLNPTSPEYYISRRYSFRN